MAKKQFKKTEEQNSKLPSQFGSHSSMIDDSVEVDVSKITEDIVSTLSGDPDRKEAEVIVLKDNYGQYLTISDRLDTRLADVNRQRGFAPKGTSISSSNFESRQAMVDSLILQEENEDGHTD